MNNFFNSTRFFQIWIYTVSHSRLILRSVNNKERDVNGFNIDIEFWGVGYLELSDKFNGISIQEIKEDKPEKFSKYSESLGYKVFEVRSNGINSYIVAAGCRVGGNNWENENRILNPDLEYNEIFAHTGAG
jgi:hypothetical protein